LIVDLGSLHPDDVDVQAAFGRVDESDSIGGAETVSLKPTGSHEQGQWRYEGDVPLSRTGPFGYTVRVLPKHAAMASPADVGLVASA